MKEKNWINCPSCGSRGTMKPKQGIYETYNIKGYAPIKVGPLDGQFCLVCGDGFYSIKSGRTVNSQIAESKAKQDSDRTVASELLDVNTIAKKLGISRQRIHQMMSEGKLQYVYVGSLRFPLKRNEARLKKIKKSLRIRH
jgi:hypothetical protein